MTTSTWLSRNDFRDIYLRAIKTRADALGITASVGPGEGAYVDACACADQCLVLSNYAQNITGSVSLDSLTGDQLDTYGKARGCSRPPARGASGSVTVSTGKTGATIVEGDLLVNNATQIQYMATSTISVSDGNEIAVITATETGTNTNVNGGTVLSWVSPRPGLFASAVVVTQPNGNGLSGGASAMSDDDYRALLRRNNAAPIGIYNNTMLLQLIADSDGSFARGDTTGMVIDSTSTGHGVGVEQGFVYPAIWGPGTVGFTFTLSSASNGSLRLPSPAQIQTVKNYVSQYISQGESLLSLVPLKYPLPAITIKIKFSQSGFEDSIAWPPYDSSGYYVVDNTNRDIPTPTVFDISTTLLNTSPNFVPPVTGKHIAVFDPTTGKFFKKSIGKVEAVAAVSSPYTATWKITCDPDANASDTTFNPAMCRVCPWSDSLQSIADIVVARAAVLGPGEAISPAPPDGIRTQRYPSSSGTNFSATMNSLGISEIYQLSNVVSAQWVTGDLSPIVDNDGISVRLPILDKLEIFPL